MMSDEIVNRVAKSPLVTIDLEEFYPEGSRQGIDLSQWLYEGVILKEKEFRASLKEYDWSSHKDAFVYLHCSTDAILPGWAFMLVAMHLAPYAKKVVEGTVNDLERSLIEESIRDIDPSEYEGKPVIIKGCTHKPIPQEAYVTLALHLKDSARSIMYGEACSSVPLFKR